MDSMGSEDMVLGQRELYRHGLSFLKSMALKCAVELGIPGAIYLHGGAATLLDIVAATGLPASRKPHLRRLMNVLAISGVFASSDPPPATATADGNAIDDGGDTVVYRLTPTSRLLVDGGDGTTGCMSPFVQFLVNPLTVTTFFGMHAWLREEPAAATATKSFFEMTHGCSRYEMAMRDADENAAYNGAMVAASQMTMGIVLGEAGGDIFGGLSSLVDVGGGHGAASAAIARALPRVKCSVLDLPHVVSQAPADGTVQFIAGDMFEFVPRADAALLKWVLHCWDDDDCVKILQRCKEAILTREAGGKVIIIDAVMGSGPQDLASKETQALYDLHLMHVNGVERDERQWEKIILEAGFSAYKIVLAAGMHSVIEVYP